MKNNDSYQQLINRIQTIKPQLTNEQVFDKEILERLHQKSSHPASVIVQWLRPALTTAALFLITLFIYLETESHQPSIQQNIAVNHKHSDHRLAQAAQHSNTSCLNNQGLFDIYRCLRKEHQPHHSQSLLIQRLTQKLSH